MSPKESATGKLPPEETAVRDAGFVKSPFFLGLPVIPAQEYVRPTEYIETRGPARRSVDDLSFFFGRVRDHAIANLACNMRGFELGTKEIKSLLENLINWK